MKTREAIWLNRLKIIEGLARRGLADAGKHVTGIDQRAALESTLQSIFFVATKPITRAEDSE